MTVEEIMHLARMLFDGHGSYKDYKREFKLALRKLEVGESLALRKYFLSHEQWKDMKAGNIFFAKDMRIVNRPRST